MKFGQVPVDRAAGHILAHSVPLPGGRLRKGMVLGAGELAALKAAGWTRIAVARLEDGDLHENAAAARLAAALVPDPARAGLRLSEPFTGRVNLIAEGPGVARINAQRVDAVNRVHPMITLATVPRWQRMEPGGMVATVKIIAYGVPGVSVSAAAAHAGGAVSLVRPVLRDAVLIETLVGSERSRPGGDKGNDKGWRMMQARLDRLGVALAPRQTVEHRTEPLAAAIAARREALILVLTGSATSDPADIAPEALRRAGGAVARFGMPVDPGNLLFLGDLAGRAVIGLPGSARSPALSGVDWVLERVICGIAPSSDEIAAMGVGGLLKEIPTRPQPRAGRPGG
ncbi:MAG: molybdopterin-binding protein [Jhaorihella sp.]